MKFIVHTKTCAALITLFVLLSILPTFSAQQDERPDIILAERANMFPEGIEWDAESEQFLLSSLTEGTVFAVNDDGTVTPFIEDEVLIGSGGIHIDPERDRLLVAVGDPAVIADPEAEGQGAIGIYDLNTGEHLHFANLRDLRPSGKQLVNDVTVDADGNVYGTESFAPVIYQVDPDSNASIFLEENRLNPEPIGLIPFPIGLNGIVHHPDGYLLVAHVAGGALFKIPLDDPQGLTQVELDEPFGADGMILRPNGELVAVAFTFDAENNPQQEVLEVSSDDDWATASITERVDVSDLPPTTIALRGDAVYAIAMHLDAWLAGEGVDAYEIYRIDFEDDGM